jgi:putative ubiquitin-RnfH superfamily antitoxin RatB of RatAB toxin-antitoxin module
MSESETQVVEVVYALPGHQTVVRVEFAGRMTAIAAVESSGLLQLHEELAGRSLDLGIFGRLVAPDQPLRNGDRVEIYRALKADPRTTRRRLAAEGKTMGSGGTSGRS